MASAVLESRLRVPNMEKKSRDPNLDLLRAIAIIAVVLYHIAGMWPTDYGPLKAFASLGKYGVTLFFVLSGWLIGGIYWREYQSTGRVRLTEFWLRRWLRTVPPYLAGLALGYCAVLYTRGAYFDLAYLFFLQNYEVELPYYLISWSLCVEEHFYLLLPFIGAGLVRLPVRAMAAGIWLLPMVSPLLRLLDPNVNLEAPFGYSHTATHLVSEGLALGVAASYSANCFPKQWCVGQRWARRLVAPACVAFISIAWWGDAVRFYLGQSVVALCCLVWHAACAGFESQRISSSKFVYWIAVTSYSVYLTHSLAIHVALRVVPPKRTLVSECCALACWIIIIASVGAVFYLFVERRSIQFRDYVTRSTWSIIGRSCRHSAVVESLKPTRD